MRAVKAFLLIALLLLPNPAQAWFFEDGGVVPSFNVPLTTTTVPLVCGSCTPTFTRATTAYVVDFEGLYKEVQSGVIRFEGANHVRNLYTNSAALTTQGVTTIAGTYLASCYGTGSITFSGTATGTLNCTAGRASSSLTTTAGTLTSTVSGTVTNAQLENRTGASNTTTPMEYVDSATSYGAGANGVRYFNVDYTGAAIADATLKGYLAEGARTNSVLQSRQFDTSWTQAGTPTPTQNETGIDGVTNKAWTLTDNDAAGFEGIDGTAVTISNDSNTHTCSVYIKKDADTSAFPEVQCKLQNGTGQYVLTQVNTSTGATANRDSVGTVVVSVESFGSWWKIRQSVTNNSSGNTNLAMSIYAAVGLTIGGADATAVRSVIIDQAQVELNAPFPSSPIYTTTGSVTRNLDSETYVSAGNTSTTNMSIFLTVTPQSTGGTRYYWGSYVDANNSTGIFYDGTNVTCRKRVSGSNYDATKAHTPAIGTAFRVGCRFSSSTGVDVWVDGTKGTGNANTTALQLGTNFSIGNDGNSASPAFSSIKKLPIYKKALSDSAMQRLSQ